MKIQIYISLHLCLLLFLPVSSLSPHSDEEIHSNMYTARKFCGSVLADTISKLCRTLHAYRRRRSVEHECCKNQCTYSHIIRYYCAEPRIPIDKLPTPSSSAMAPIDSKSNTGPLRKILLNPSQDSMQSATERISQSSENNNNGQGKMPITNQIFKDKEKSENLEVNNRPPAKFGIHTTRRPAVIYPHSENIEKGHYNYKINKNFSSE